MPSYFLNKKTKTQNTNKDADETKAEESYSENESETNEEIFQGNISKKFENNQQDPLEIDNYESSKLLDINSGTT